MASSAFLTPSSLSTFSMKARSSVNCFIRLFAALAFVDQLLAQLRDIVAPLAPLIDLVEPALLLLALL